MRSFPALELAFGLPQLLGKRRGGSGECATLPGDHPIAELKPWSRDRNHDQAPGCQLRLHQGECCTDEGV